MAAPPELLRQHRNRTILLAAIVIAIAVLAASEPMQRFVRSILAVSGPFIQRHAVAGAALFVVLSALSAMFVFLSTAIVTPVAVDAYGSLTTLLLLWAGWIAGGITSYAIGRFLGRRVVRWFVDPRKIVEYEQRAQRLDTFGHVLLFQIAVPSEIPGYVLGLAGCRFRTYVMAMALGELPFALGAVFLGESFLQRNYLLLFAVGICGVALSWIAFRAVIHHNGGVAPGFADASNSAVSTWGRFSMLIKDVMTRTPTFCRPDDTLDEVARLMLEHECGEIPVCDGLNVVGVITDRDITCRAVAKRKEPGATKVSDVMTHNVFSVRENDKVSAAIALFQDTLVRRLPVINEDGYLVGIVSQADLAAKMPSFRIAHALKTVAKKTRRQMVVVMAILFALAPVAFGQRPQHDSGRTMHRDNERITVEGRVRTIHRERDGYRVELDRIDESFFVPERALRNRTRDFRIGVSLRFAGIFHDGIVVVDVVDWPPFEPRREHRRYAEVLRGFVERVHLRSASLRVREERTGRLIDVDVRAPYAMTELRPGDYITLTGEWTDRDEFTATHIDAVRPRHR